MSNTIENPQQLSKQNIQPIDLEKTKIIKANIKVLDENRSQINVVFDNYIQYRLYEGPNAFVPPSADSLIGLNKQNAYTLLLDQNLPEGRSYSAEYYEQVQDSFKNHVNVPYNSFVTEQQIKDNAERIDPKAIPVKESDLNNIPIRSAEVVAGTDDKYRLNVIYENNIQQTMMETPLRNDIPSLETIVNLDRSQAHKVILSHYQNEHKDMNLKESLFSVDQKLRLSPEGTPGTEDLNNYTLRLTPEQASEKEHKFRSKSILQSINSLEEAQLNYKNIIDKERQVLKDFKEVKLLKVDFDMAEHKFNRNDIIFSHTAVQLYKDPKGVADNIGNLLKSKLVLQPKEISTERLSQILYENYKDIGEVKFNPLRDYSPKYQQQTRDICNSMARQYKDLITSYEKLDIVSRKVLGSNYAKAGSTWTEKIQAVRNYFNSHLPKMEGGLKVIASNIQALRYQKDELSQKLQSQLSKTFKPRLRSGISTDKNMTKKVAESLKISPGTTGFKLLQQAVKTVNSQSREAVLSL